MFFTAMADFTTTVTTVTFTMADFTTTVTTVTFTPWQDSKCLLSVAMGTPQIN